ncbi:MAG: transcriptional repressor [Firmicutes bacterium]|nr:transcriptional repressor [Bacillota bacterium]
MPETNDLERSRKGTRSTRQRRAILDLLKQEKIHLAAEEIYQAVRQTQPNISLGTVYRNLEVLTELGLLSKVVFTDGKSRYELAERGHHHHLICLGCGDTVDIPDCPVDKTIDCFMRDKKFRPARHHFEVYGYCAKCQD